MTEILFQPLGNPLAASRPMEKIADIDSRLTRTHYFDGRLLTAEDLERDQIYLDERLREAGKVLGEGVASGLELSFDRYSGLLTLEAGYGVTRHGRILQLDEQLTVNVTDSVTEDAVSVSVAIETAAVSAVDAEVFRSASVTSM